MGRIGNEKILKNKKWSYHQDAKLKRYQLDKKLQDVLKRSALQFSTETLVPAVETLVRVTQFASTKQSESASMSENECCYFSTDLNQSHLDYVDHSEKDEMDMSDTIDPEFQGLLENATEKERYAALLALFYGTNMSQTAFKIVVQYLNIGGSEIPQKFDQVVNRFLGSDFEGRLHPTQNYKKSYNCKRCSCVLTGLSHLKQRACLKCKDRLAMHYYFDIESQIKRIINKNIINFDRQAATAECSTISDIVDGSIYREFLQSAQGKCVLRGNGFTLSINTDGADPSDKSTISLWPVFLVINEIPLEKRYCIENIIIAGKFYYLFNIIVAGADSVIFF